MGAVNMCSLHVDSYGFEFVCLLHCGGDLGGEELQKDLLGGFLCPKVSSVSLYSSNR